MKKFLNNIKQEAGHIRMSEAEKSAMKAAIFGLSGQGAPSPVPAHQSPYFFFSYQFRMVLAGLVLFVVVGASSAAASSLPGDALYPLKINVNEAVKVALAPSPAAKAQIHAELADARVEEAQALAVQGRLDATTSAELAANFDEHAQSAEALADEAEPADPAAAAQIKTRLASSLAANGAVLQLIGRGSHDRATQEESDSFGTRVIARAGAPERLAMNAHAFAATAPAAAAPAPQEGDTLVKTTSFKSSGSAKADEDTGNQNVSVSLQEKSVEALIGVKALFEKIKGGIDATTTTQIEKEFADADALMSTGAQELGAGNYEQAQNDFTGVLRASARLSALLVAQKRFDGGILKGLIRRDSEDSNQQENSPAKEDSHSSQIKIELGH